MCFWTKQELSTATRTWSQNLERSKFSTWLVGNLINSSSCDWNHLDSVLEPLVPKEDKVEDFIDIKASNILKESNKYKYATFI